MESVYCELLQGENWDSFINVSWHKINAQYMFGSMTECERQRERAQERPHHT